MTAFETFSVELIGQLIVPAVLVGLFGFFNAASGLIVVVPLIKSGKGRSVVVVVVALKVSVPLKG